MRFWKPILIICCIAGAVFFLRKAGLTGCPFACCSTPVPATTSVSPVSEDEPPTESPRRLIESVSDEPVEWTGRNPAAKRARRIVPDPSWMTPDPVLKAGDVITLELFDDAVFEAEIRNVTRYPNGSVGMTAHLTGEQNGTVYLSYSDGAMRASVEPSIGSDYVVRHWAGENIHYALEVDRDRSEVLEGGEPLVPPMSSRDSAENGVDSFSVPMNTVLGTPSGVTIVDVMILYTPDARNWEGSTEDMETNIAEAMQRSNEAHTNSNTQVYLNLVYSAEVDYTSGGDSGLVLDRLRLTDDEYMDDVHTLRDTHKADLVCLFEELSDAGGRGYLLDNTNGMPGYAFSVVRVQQSSWTYTLVHEWGHNMGCHHSKSQSSGWGPTDWDNWPENTWSAGWQWETNTTSLPYGPCTIMTYEDFNGDDADEYERIPYFSNPDINYPGTSTPVGDAADGDNARTIRETRAVIADYREAPDKDYDGLPNEWELQYFGGETNATAGTDDDGDGFSNLEEYISGFNPTNSESFFAVDSFSVPQSETNGFIVRWTAASGRVYSVNWTTNLLGSFQPLKTNILSPQASWTDTVHNSEAEGFYRVDVELAE